MNTHKNRIEMICVNAIEFMSVIKINALYLILGCRDAKR